MKPETEKEEKLRESACTGDLDQLRQLIEDAHTNINAQNTMNGWTALHWACKRNHVAVVKYLLSRGADKDIQNSNKELAGQLTNTAEIRHILDYSGSTSEDTPLPITASYLQHPVFPYGIDKEAINRLSDGGNRIQHQPDPSVQTRELHIDPNEVVLKARVAYSMERDFIEVDLDRSKLTYESLVSLLTKELGIDRQLLHKVRKLPNTIVRKDKDVRRLLDYQELELVLTTKAMSAMSRSYGDTTGSDGFKHEQIFY